MSPGRVRQSVVAAKSEAVRRMVEEIGTLPLATVAEFTADPFLPARGCGSADGASRLKCTAFGRP